MYRTIYPYLIFIIFVSGCCFAPYRSSVKIEQPIRVPTFIFVDRTYTTFAEAVGRGFVLAAFFPQIENAIVEDLQANVFPDTVFEDPDLYVHVQLLEVYVDAMCKGRVDIKCVLQLPDDTVIKTYDVRGTSGMKFSITQAAMAATQDAIEKIKIKIDEERLDIIRALRIH
jgi:hypothetical protein